MYLFTINNTNAINDIKSYKSTIDKIYKASLSLQIVFLFFFSIISFYSLIYKKPSWGPTIFTILYMCSSIVLTERSNNSLYSLSSTLSDYMASIDSSVSTLKQEIADFDISDAPANKDRLDSLNSLYQGLQGNVSQIQSSSSLLSSTAATLNQNILTTQSNLNQVSQNLSTVQSTLEGVNRTTSSLNVLNLIYDNLDGFSLISALALAGEEDLYTHLSNNEILPYFMNSVNNTTSGYCPTDGEQSFNFPLRFIYNYGNNGIFNIQFNNLFSNEVIYFKSNSLNYLSFDDSFLSPTPLTLIDNINLNYYIKNGSIKIYEGNSKSLISLQLTSHGYNFILGNFLNNQQDINAFINPFGVVGEFNINGLNNSQTFLTSREIKMPLNSYSYSNSSPLTLGSNLSQSVKVFVNRSSLNQNQLTINSSNFINSYSYSFDESQQSRTIQYSNNQLIVKALYSGNYGVPYNKLEVILDFQSNVNRAISIVPTNDLKFTFNVYLKDGKGGYILERPNVLTINSF